MISPTFTILFFVVVIDDSVIIMYFAPRCNRLRTAGCRLQMFKDFVFFAMIDFKWGWFWCSGGFFCCGSLRGRFFRLYRWLRGFAGRLNAKRLRRILRSGCLSKNRGYRPCLSGLYTKRLKAANRDLYRGRYPFFLNLKRSAGQGRLYPTVVLCSVKSL